MTDKQILASSLLVAALLLGTAPLGCQRSNLANESQRDAADKSERTEPARSPEEIAEDRKADESQHRVVFADRSSMGYLLLLPGVQKPELMAREDVVSAIRQEFAANLDDEEVRLLEYYAGLEPRDGALPVQVDPDDPDSAMRTAAARYDLIGTHFEIVAVHDEIPEVALKDPIMIRDVAPELRPTIPRRKWALLIRGDYRSRNAFRGLRLLQALVRVVAKDQDALIHDPDTLETMDLESFSRRRLQSSMGNVADQIAIVPFPDPRHGEGHVRLSSRGMRRFGAVDIELDGLPKDPAVLQRATDMLQGLALVLVRESEVTETGLATELDEVVSVTWRDIEAAYQSRGQSPPRCEGCREEAVVHLVEREAEPHDPRDHVVARVVAPRSKSDLPGYDHPVWVRQALKNLFGAP